MNSEEFLYSFKYLEIWNVRYSINLVLDKIPFAQKTLDNIFTILSRSINFIIINVVVFYIYSIIGVNLFCFLKHSQ